MSSRVRSKSVARKSLPKRSPDDRRGTSPREAKPTRRAARLAATAATAGRRHGQPVPEEVRRHALELLVSKMPPCEVARSVGVTTESLRNWRRRAEAEGTMPQAAPNGSAGGNGAGRTDAGPPPVPTTNAVHAPTAPHDAASGLGAHEVDAILELKKRHPSMGPAQLRTQLKRFKGWRLSVKAIARVLKRAGYELVHVGSRPQGQEHPRRWEAPHRNAIWQADFVELRVGPERRSLLVVEDDYSRFLVAHALMETPTSEAVVEVLRAAIARHGKPEVLYTDRGGPFCAWRRETALAHYLERELIDHVVSRPYRPQGRGKVESLAGTVRRELWDIEHFESVDEAAAALVRFFEHYNHRRAHMGLDGLVPADRFFGRGPEVLARMQAASRRRQGLLSNGHGGDPFVSEEHEPAAPWEVLRLVVVEGRMELRFVGHRVDLGAVQP